MSRAEGCENLDTFFPEDLKDSEFHTRYFFPNYCHLCSPDKENGDQLIRCEKCNMISYCGEYHQKKHAKKHQDLCQVIQNLLELQKSKNLFDFMKRDTSNEHLQMKYSLIATVEKELNRQLYDDEKQMFLYPRFCFSCFETDPDSLLNCKCCPQVCFCKEHEFDVVDDHKGSMICKNFDLCFHLDWRSMVDDRYNIFANTINFPFLGLNPNTFRDGLDDMETFLDYFGQTEKSRLMNTLNETQLSKICSKLYTNSLTVMHVIKELGLEGQSGLVIHIIGAQHSRRRDFAIYEVLLHLVRNLKNLEVIAVGLELEQLDKRIAREVETCRYCIEKKKTFFVTSIKMPYASYVESTSFKTPHFIITYNFEESVESAETLLTMMMKIRVPFVMTTNSKLNTTYKQMIERFPNLDKNSCFYQNQFRSMRPYRHELENEFKFDNDYISFFFFDKLKTSIQIELHSDKIQDLLDSDGKIELPLESKPDGNKDPGDENLKEIMKEADQASNLARKRTSLMKEEKLKDAKEKDVPETLGSQSHPTEESKSETGESSVHSEEKVDDRLEEIKKRIQYLRQENVLLFKSINSFTYKILSREQKGSAMVRKLLEECLAFKICLNGCTEKISKQLQVSF